MNRPARPSFLRAITGAALPAALLLGCGGNVVVDGTGTGGSGAAGGSGGTTVTVTDPDDCPPGLTLCDGACVDTSSDPAHCGGCGTICEQGASCSGGDCVVSQACFCGEICSPTDLGSKVPQTVVDSTGGQEDVFFLSCAGQSGADRMYSFTPPTEGVYSFDAFGSSVDTAIAVLDPACDVLGCNEGLVFNGAPGFSVKLPGGQPVLVVIDALGGPGEVILHIASADDCTGCAAFVAEVEPDQFLCPASEALYQQVETCICDGPCAIDCVDLCQFPGDLIDSCWLCATSSTGCVDLVNECANDP